MEVAPVDKKTKRREYALEYYHKKRDHINAQRKQRRTTKKAAIIAEPVANNDAPVACCSTRV